MLSHFPSLVQGKRVLFPSLHAKWKRIPRNLRHASLGSPGDWGIGWWISESCLWGCKDRRLAAGPDTPVWTADQRVSFWDSSPLPEIGRAKVHFLPWAWCGLYGREPSLGHLEVDTSQESWVDHLWGWGILLRKSKGVNYCWTGQRRGTEALARGDCPCQKIVAGSVKYRSVKK